MHYHGVGNRCAVNFKDLHLPITDHEALRLLKIIGIYPVEVDIIAAAHDIAGHATYKRGARMQDAPHTFDCSSLIKWLYGQRGIWLPRRSIQQREYGEYVEPENIQTGDIVFTSGRIDYFDRDPTDGVGHVGIVTGSGTIIHAANRRRGVVESPYDVFKHRGLRGIRRLIPCDTSVYTLESTERETEWSDDFRWIILQQLKT